MRYIAIVALVTLFSHTHGQDIRFTQFYNTPTVFNPAATGVIKGNHRLCIGYHNQNSRVLRGDSFSAALLSYDGRFSISQDGAIGIGLAGIVDGSGELNYGAEQSKLLLSYIHAFTTSNRNSTLSLGVDLENSKRFISPSNTRIAAQLKNPSFGHDVYIDPNERTKHMYLGAGLVWSSFFDSGHNYQLGVSAHHLNQARITYYRGFITDTLTVRYSVQGSVQIPLSQNVFLRPSALYFSQGGHRSIIAGSMLRFDNNEKVNNLELGIYLNLERSDFFTNIKGVESLTMATNIHFDKLSFAFTYDYVFQKSLRQAGNLDSAFELMMGYVIERPLNSVSNK